MDSFTTGRQRALGIEGGHNLRDLGGYEAADGRRVKWGLLYRSGVIRHGDDAARAALLGLGITAICDLRTPQERAHRPMDWHDTGATRYLTGDYELSAGNLDQLIAQEETTPEAMVRVMQTVYRELPFEQAPGYRSLFGQLLTGRVPLLFNCTAGKDRTGVAAALILHTLGVKRAAIEHDYTLTDAVIGRLEAILLADARYAGLQAKPRKVYLPLLTADPGYLAIAFAAMEERHGTIEGYLSAALGVGPAETAALRGLLLE